VATPTGAGRCGFTSYLLIQTLLRFHDALSPDTTITGSGNGRGVTPHAMAQEVANRMTRIFTRDSQSRRACFGQYQKLHLHHLVCKFGDSANWDRGRDPRVAARLRAGVAAGGRGWGRGEPIRARGRGGVRGREQGPGREAN